MRIRILIATLTLCCLAGAGQAGVWDKVQSTFGINQPKPPMIKVLIVSNKDAVILEVKGQYNIKDPNTDSRLGTRFMGKGHLIQPTLGGLKWGEEFPGVYQIAIIPDDQHISTVVDGIEYRGNIYVYDIKGKLSVVNEVDLEDYLSSVLAYEFREDYNPEAMAAVAIVERTNALFQSYSKANSYWNVKAEDVDYEGHGVTGRNNNVDQAIASTRYMVMSQNGQKAVTPFPATWSYGAQQSSSIPMLSIDEADAMASKGSNAGQILSKKFPNTSLQLSYNKKS
jgi:stage II sporulation protein D